MGSRSYLQKLQESCGVDMQISAVFWGGVLVVRGEGEGASEQDTYLDLEQGDDHFVENLG